MAEAARPFASARKTVMRYVRCLAVAIVFATFAGVTHADTYYVVVFGAQSKPPRPKYSHS